MNPNSMRKIDYWVGRPICLLLTLVYKLQRLVGLKDSRPNQEPKNFLFIELAEMGSTVLAYPAMKQTREDFPKAKIYFLLFKQIRASMDIIDFIPEENVFTIDESSIFTVTRDTLKFMWLSRWKKIDTTINLEMFTRFGTILSFLSGARKRVGFHRYHQEGLYVGDLLTHKVSYNPHIHSAHSFLALIEALHAPSDQMPLVKFSVEDKRLEIPRRQIEDQGKNKIWSLLKNENSNVDENKKLVLLNPNASKLISIRKWPLENYATLAQKLLQDDNVFLAITGVASEKPDADYICDRVKNPRVMNLAGKTSLRDLLDLYQLGRVLITNDSGPAHFAALTPIHIVVFFGPETPKLYRPLTDNCTVMYSNFACSPCVSAFNQRLSSCNDNQCLKTIDVDRVYGTVKDVIARA
ncbi:MAG: hypothetical protein GTO40_31140 [Deltaproteobacteria bacterium]|nr:hypothetical protein [Deltaproteobacteria bacterium]